VAFRRPDPEPSRRPDPEPSRRPDPVALLRALHDGQVEFVAVGQSALIMFGAPNVTGDVDITPRQHVANAERLADALSRLEARHVAAGEVTDAPVDQRDFLGCRTLHLRTALGHLDVVPWLTGVGSYDEVRPRAISVEVSSGVHVLAAHPEDVLRSKEALGREKDRAALPQLRRWRATLDVDRLGEA
jgi:hypothetical protein